MHVCNTNGQCSRKIGSVGIEPGQFRDIFGLEVDNRGNLFVADRANHRIQVCDYQGSCFAYGSFGLTPGTQFARPTDVALDNRNRLYVLERGANRVQIFQVLYAGEEPPFTMNAGLGGNWWKGPDRSGEGVQIEVADGGDGSLVFVATFYSYDLMGNQIFLVAVGAVNDDTAEVDVFITEGGMWGDDFDPALVTETQWGTGVFTASGCDDIHMRLTPNAEHQALGYTDLEYDLIRLTTPLISC